MNTEFHIRELRQSEVPQLKALYKENLWLLDRLIFGGVFYSVMKERNFKGPHVSWQLMAIKSFDPFAYDGWKSKANVTV